MPQNEASPSGPKLIGGLAGLAIVAVALPAAFRLGYGRIDGFAIGLTAFLVMIAAAVEYLPRKTDEALAAGLDQRLDHRPRWFDRLGVVWLLAIPFAPFFAWVLRNLIDIDRDNWTWVLGFSAFFCVVVPLVCVLPMLRYIRRGTAGIALTVLAVGTGFPVMTGLGSAYDFVQGPIWQAVTIERIGDVDFRTGTGTQVHAGAVLVHLADGRRLSRSPRVPLREGPAELLVLRGIGRVIGARP